MQKQATLLCYYSLAGSGDRRRTELGNVSGSKRGADAVYVICHDQQHRFDERHCTVLRTHVGHYSVVFTTHSRGYSDSDQQGKVLKYSRNYDFCYEFLQWMSVKQCDDGCDRHITKRSECQTIIRMQVRTAYPCEDRVPLLVRMSKCSRIQNGFLFRDGFKAVCGSNLLTVVPLYIFRLTVTVHRDEFRCRFVYNLTASQVWRDKHLSLDSPTIPSACEPWANNN